MKSAFRLFPVLLTAVLLGACAQTGQVVSLSPSADVPETRTGAGREVAVRTVDRRQAPALGRLENRRNEPGVLTTEQDLEQVMTDAASQALRRNGFRPVPWRDGAARSLTVEIRELAHVVSSELPREVSTRVELGFDAVNGGRGLSGTAQHRQSREVTYRPTAEENGAWISEAVDSALQRLFSDRLLELLAAP